jgi:hypothetical protein
MPRNCIEFYSYESISICQPNLGHLHGSETCRSFHIATALVVSFLGKLAIELTGFHLTTALIDRFSRHATRRLLCCGERRSREHEQNKGRNDGANVMMFVHRISWSYER